MIITCDMESSEWIGLYQPLVPFKTHFTEVVPNRDKLACVCLFVKKKKAFSSDEWLFFCRKVIATFSATEMMTKFAVFGSKNTDFVLSAHDGV